MKVTIDSEVCIGCGVCVSVDDKAFAFDDEGKAHVIGECDEAVADEVISSCPVGAISK